MFHRFLLFAVLLVAFEGTASTYASGQIHTRVGKNSNDDIFTKIDAVLATEWASQSGEWQLDAQARGIYLYNLDDSNVMVDSLLLKWSPNDHLETYVGVTSQVWGRLDELTAIDFPFAEERQWQYWDSLKNRKRSRTLIGQNIFWGNQSLTLMLFPEPAQNEPENISNGWCDEVCLWADINEQSRLFSDIGFNVQFDDRPQEDKPEMAFRWTGLAGDIDLGTTVYYGSDHYNRVARRFIDNQTVALYEPVIQDWSAGFDAAYSISSWVLRAELAYRNTVALPLEPTSETYLLDDDGFNDTTATSIAAAVETTILNSIRLNFQYLFTDFDDQTDAIIPRETHASTLFLEKNIYEFNLIVDNLLIYDIEHKGYHNKLRALWSPYQGGQFGAELLLFKGDNPKRNYGFLSANNGLNLTYHHEF